MRLKIPGLCLVKDFADVVDWLLDSPDTSGRVRLALVRFVRSLGPQRFWVPTGTRLLRTPLAGSGASGRGEADGPPCSGSGSPSLVGETLVSPWRACSVLSATSTMLTASAEAARYRNNVSPGSGATNTGSEVRCCFSSWKACSASSVQENGPDLLNSLKKGRALSA